MGISGSDDGTLKHWELRSGKCLRTLKGHSDIVWSVAPVGNEQCISGSDDHTLKHWELSSGKCLRTLKGQSKASSQYTRLVPIPNAARSTSSQLDAITGEGGSGHMNLFAILIKTWRA